MCHNSPSCEVDPPYQWNNTEYYLTSSIPLIVASLGGKIAIFTILKVNGLRPSCQLERWDDLNLKPTRLQYFLENR